MQRIFSKYGYLLFIAIGVVLMPSCNDEDDPEPKYILNMEANPEGAGSVTGAGEYLAGEQVQIDASSAEGYAFEEWTGNTIYVDDPGSANAIVVMPAHHIFLTANFTEIKAVDIDGNVYQTVIIGDQEWFTENLRVTRYNNGDAMATGLNDEDWGSITDGAYAVYPHGGGITESDVEGIHSDAEMVAAYGKLYNWYAVADPRGLCPDGWSVPGDGDWTQLIDYVVSHGFMNDPDDPAGAGNALKSCRQLGSPISGCDISEHPRWNADGTHHGFDEFGFTALPGGDRWSNGNFSFIGGFGLWWSSEEQSSDSAWSRFMSRNNGRVTRSYSPKNYGHSVRCFREVVRTEDGKGNEE